MNMATVESVLLALLVVDAIALTVLVLLQQGKGADAGASFGSGSSNTMFGSLGAASFLTKSTAWLSIGFFLIAFGLAYVAKERAAAAGTIGIPTVQTGEVPAILEESGSDVPGVAQDDVDAALEAALEKVQEAVDAVDGDVPALDAPATDDVPEVPSPN